MNGTGSLYGIVLAINFMKSEHVLKIEMAFASYDRLMSFFARRSLLRLNIIFVSSLAALILR